MAILLHNFTEHLLTAVQTKFSKSNVTAIGYPVVIEGHLCKRGLLKSGQKMGVPLPPSPPLPSVLQDILNVLWTAVTLPNKRDSLK